MVKKLFVVMLAVMTLVISGGIESASAVGEGYTYEYSDINIYSEDTVLIYHFTNLDAAVTYTWRIQMVTESGFVLGGLGTQTASGVTTATRTWTAASGSWSLASGIKYTGAIQIVDHFGQVLGQHYIAFGCSVPGALQCVGISDWHETVPSEINPVTNRFGIGRNFTVQTMNGDGYWHPYTKSNLVVTRANGTTLLHYRAAVPSTDILRIYPRNSTQHIAEFSLAELVAYNTFTGLTVLTSNYNLASYVILNTNLSVLPYLNEPQNDAAFSGNFDNPHKIVIPKGAYDYKRLTSGGVNLVDGESVLLVADSNAGEWILESTKPLVIPLGQTSFGLRSETGEIWSDGYIDSTLTDAIVGVVDTLDYSYAKRREFSYTVGAFNDDILVSWNMAPTSSNYFLATLAQRSFTVTTQYDILEDYAPQGRVENTLAGFGFDTTLGRALGLIIVILAVTLFMSIKGGVRNANPYYIAFMACGGIWLGLGLGDAITAMIYGAVTMLMVFVMVRSRSSGGSNQGI